MTVTQWYLWFFSDVPLDGCSVTDMKSCTLRYLDIVFKEYSAAGAPDYNLMCRCVFVLTVSCAGVYGARVKQSHVQVCLCARVTVSGLL